MAVIVNGDGILTGVSSLTTALDDITSGRGTVTGVATVGTLQLGTGVSISSPRSQQAAIFTNNTEFFTVDDAGRVGVGTVTPNSDAHPQNVGKINVGFITARSVAGDIDANTMVVAGVSTFVGALNGSSVTLSGQMQSVSAVVTGGITATGGNIVMNDSSGSSANRIKLGTSQDLQLFHDGSDSRIINNTGLTYLQGDVIRFRNQADSSTILNASTSGVDLYGGTSLILGTGAGGVTISGISTVTTSLNSTGTGSPIVQISNTRVNTGSGAAGLRFVTNEISGSDQYTRAQISAEYDGASNVSGRLILSTTNSSGTLTARVRIDDDGNVGINDSSPDCKLDIDSGSNGDNHKIADFKGTSVGNAASLQVRYFACGSDDNRSGLYWQHENVGNMRMWMGDDSKLRMSNATPGSANAGNAFVQEGVSASNIVMANGNGISFAATGDGSGTDTSELFDDYEEGEWIPDVRGSSSAGSATYVSRTGHYVKIGRLVMLFSDVRWSGHSGSGSLEVHGLPYNIQDSGYTSHFGISYNNGHSHNNNHTYGWANNSGDYIRYWETNSSGGSGGLSLDTVVAEIHFYGQYISA